jgi:DNA-binding NarL/FixJ family response regulator
VSEGDQPIRVFLVHDDGLIRRSLADVLDADAGFTLVGSAASAKEALASMPAARPDVALLAAGAAEGTGVDLCRALRESLPGTYCLILTAAGDDDALLSAVLAGASGYLSTQVPTGQLLQAIRQVALGRSVLDPAVFAQVMNRVRSRHPSPRRLAMLTPRQRQVLELLGEGLTNRQIGQRLALSDKTVSNHITNMLHQLGLPTRPTAALFAREILTGGSQA